MESHAVWHHLRECGVQSGISVLQFGEQCVALRGVDGQFGVAIARRVVGEKDAQLPSEFLAPVL